MKKYKVIVYAISKNEKKFVDRWYESMKEADEIYVLDTGSTDNTVEKLKSHNIITKTKIINPWRFDVARNESLNMVPLDAEICVCTDLDEILKPGWRKEIENSWKSNTTRLRYTYNWKLDKNDKPLVSFLYEKIHKRTGYKWIYPVHEVLLYDGNENVETNENIILNHYPDINKSRGSYLKLLELAYKENPDNDRICHYLGREYMYHKKWNKSIDTLIKHLNLKSSTWKDERCASMRFISRCYIELKRYDEAFMWLSKAIEEAPYLREPYIETALLAYQFNDWKTIKENVLKALNIEKNYKTYINETFCYDATPYDLISLACYYLEEYKEALMYVDKAIALNPNDDRLQSNKNLIMQKIDS